MGVRPPRSTDSMFAGVPDSSGSGLETRRQAAAIAQRLFGIEDAPVSVGRFVVIDRIGDGAWGAVFRAYDPDLDRRVAVKVLHPRGPSDQGTLIEEAKALARLNHPNVVTVHEVGETDNGMVFMAMEFVEGGTLRELAAEPSDRHRSRTLTELFAQAARGLEVAHAEGIIHRDLKPANLLVGREGRLRIADFGLAQLAVATTQQEGDVGLKTTQADQSSAAGWVGTPAYMAPEQFDGESDERTDQFNLCAAFYELFFGVLPFAGKTVAAVRANVVEGTLTPAPERNVPSWIRDVLRRGLAPNPDDRYADIAELRGALERGGRGRTGLVVAGLTLAGAATVYALVPTEEPAKSCAAIAEAAAPRWSEESKQRVRDAFAASGHARAERVFESVEISLEHWSSQWVEHRERACSIDPGRASEANSSSGPVHCLDMLAQGFDSLTAALEVDDPKAVGKASVAARALTTPQSCADGGAELERALVGVPGDYVSAIYRARSLQRLGRQPEAEKDLLALRDELDRHPALAAMSDCLLAGLAHSQGHMDDMGERVESCMQAAEHDGLSETLSQAWLLRFSWLSRRKDKEGALFAVERARSIARRAEVSEVMRAGVEWRRGLALRRLDRTDESLAAYARANAMFVEQGADALRLASVACDWSEALFFSGNLDAAIEKANECAQLRIEEAGPEDPQLSQAWSMLSQYHHHARDEEAALAAAEAAEAIFKIHPWYAPRLQRVSAMNRANALSALGRFDEAQEGYDEVYKIVVERHGENSPEVMSLYNDLAVLQLKRGEPERAFAYYEKAAVLADAGAAEKSGNNAGIIYLNLALHLARRERGDEARRRLQQATTLLDPRRPDDGPISSRYRTRISQVLRHLGEYSQAQASVDRAKAIAETAGSELRLGAAWEEDVRLRLAQEDREGAAAGLARAARHYEAAGKPAAEALVELRQLAVDNGLEQP